VKWEYKIVKEETEIYDLGENGWELAAAIPDGEGMKLYLKRPQKNMRERITEEQREAVYQRFDMEEIE